MFALSDDEMEFCDQLVERAVHTAVRTIGHSRLCDEADIDNEVRLRMIETLENYSPYGRLKARVELLIAANITGTHA